MKRTAFWCLWILTLGLVLVSIPEPKPVYALDFTVSQGQLQDWQELTVAAAIVTAELDTGEGLDGSQISAILHIDMANSTTDAITAGTAGAKVFVQSGTTAEDWHLWTSVSATGGTANRQVLAAASGNGQANADRIELAATANFDGIGDVAFLQDEGTMADSTLVIIEDVVTNDYTQNFTDLANAYDTSDYIYDVVDQWNIKLPDGCQGAMVVFWMSDADGDIACRVRYEIVTDIE